LSITHSYVDTSQKEKKNAKTNSTPSHTRPTLLKKKLHDGARKKREKKRKEGRRKDLVVAGSGSRREDLVVALRHLAADPLATETHGWVSPAVGLVFFFFVFPSGLIFFCC
jgi:hypothetical protein